jgi:glycosyltransferase involved in cell wall biosynthesis
VFRVRGHVLLDALRFSLVNLGSFGLNAMLLPFFVEVIGLAIVAAQILATIVAVSCLGHSLLRSAVRPHRLPRMSMTPRVSIVIPSYNNEAYIVETMRSVLAQTFDDFEVVVADHSSTDRTLKLLAPFGHDPRVRVLTTPAGGGAERNWNRVTEEARGELVKLVCGDDVIYPEALTAQVAAFDAEDDGVAIGASTRDIVDADGKTVVRNHGLGGLSGRVPGRQALRRGVVKGANIYGEPCCVLIRREALENVGGWHGDPGFMIDQATYSRILLEGDLVATEGPIAAFRVNSAQQSVSMSREQAASAAEMHRQLARMAPGMLSRLDLLRGNSKALLRSYQRRLFYLYLGRRLRPQADFSANTQNSL